MIQLKIRQSLAAISVVLCLLGAASSYAACPEGTEVIGKNGHVYCKSNVTMNWYTAFAWCDTQGRTLATVEQICDIDDTQKWDGNFGAGKCLNIVGTGSGEVWSAIPYGSSTAFNVNLSAGYVHNGNRADMYAALCW